MITATKEMLPPEVFPERADATALEKLDDEARCGIRISLPVVETKPASRLDWLLGRKSKQVKVGTIRTAASFGSFGKEEQVKRLTSAEEAMIERHFAWWRERYIRVVPEEWTAAQNPYYGGLMETIKGYLKDPLKRQAVAEKGFLEAMVNYPMTAPVEILGQEGVLLNERLMTLAAANILLCEELSWKRVQSLADRTYWLNYRINFPQQNRLRVGLHLPSLTPDGIDGIKEQAYQWHLSRRVIGIDELLQKEPESIQ